VLPSLPVVASRRHLALAILLALPFATAVADEAPACPAGQLKCPK
jgi:LPS-assembly protein